MSKSAADSGAGGAQVIRGRFQKGQSGNPSGRAGKTGHDSGGVPTRQMVQRALWRLIRARSKPGAPPPAQWLVMAYKALGELLPEEPKSRWVPGWTPAPAPAHGSEPKTPDGGNNDDGNSGWS